MATKNYTKNAHPENKLQFNKNLHKTKWKVTKNFVVSLVFFSTKLK